MREGEMDSRVTVTKLRQAGVLHKHIIMNVWTNEKFTAFELIETYFTFLDQHSTKFKVRIQDTILKHMLLVIYPI